MISDTPIHDIAIHHIQGKYPDPWKVEVIKRMCKQCVTGSFSPPPKCLGTRLHEYKNQFKPSKHCQQQLRMNVWYMSQLKGHGQLLNCTIIHVTASGLMLPNSKWHILLKQPETRTRLTRRGWDSRSAS